MQDELAAARLDGERGPTRAEPEEIGLEGAPSQVRVDETLGGDRCEEGERLAVRIDRDRDEDALVQLEGQRAVIGVEGEILDPEGAKPYLKEEDVLEEPATLDDAQKFVEHNLKAEEMYNFYAAVRCAVFEESRRKKKK